MIGPDDKRHGTPRGYRLHREHDEPACEACSVAWYRYNKRATYLRATGNSLRVDALGTHRRVRALMALGYGLPTLAERLGIATGNLSYKLHQPYVARKTHEAVADLFESLAMQPPPEGWVAQRTRNIAVKRGWAAPLCWDDIDWDERPRGMAEVTPIRPRHADHEAAECPRCGVRRQVRVTAKGELCVDCKSVEREAS